MSLRPGGVQIRSMLFAPANHPRRVERAPEFGADAVTLDLEDAVAESEKAAARAGVAQALERYRGVLRCVRVNALGTGLAREDLDAVVCGSLDALVVPKIESADELAEYDRMLDALERARDLEPGGIRMIATVETARGILNLEAISRDSPSRVRTLLFGIGDFTADLGLRPSVDATELVVPRSLMVLACRAGGLEPPIDGPFMSIGDEDGYRRDSSRSRSTGFQGRLAIHPSQVAWANEVYGAIPEDELARLRRVVEAFERAERQGVASIQVDGAFVDYPIYRQAKSEIERYGGRTT